jgi:cobalt-zinc-cadmium efflux system outer membrane protein
VNARLLPMLALVAAAGCASAEQLQIEARARVSAEVEQRIQSTPRAEVAETAQQDDDATVRALLAAPLTDDAAVRVALLNHRGLRASLQGLGVSAAELAQAGRVPDPVLSGSARFFDAGTELEFGLTQPLLDLLFRPLRLRIAGAELAAAEARVAGETIAHAFAVRHAMLALRVELEHLHLLAAAREAADAALILTLDLHRAGNLTDRVLTAAESELAAADAELALAEAEARARRESVNALLGLWGADAAAWSPAEDTDLLADASADLDFARLESRAVAASLDLRAAHARAEAAAQRAGLAVRTGWLPSLGAGIGGERAPDSGEWGLGPSFAVGLPLFDAGSARSAGARAALMRELDSHHQLAVDVRATARALRERLAGAAAQARILRERHAPLHARLTLEVLREYDGMQVGAFEVLDAKQSELAARRALLDASLHARSARLDLEELLAGRLDPAHLHTQP